MTCDETRNEPFSSIDAESVCVALRDVRMCCGWCEVLRCARVRFVVLPKGDGWSVCTLQLTYTKITGKELYSVIQRMYLAGMVEKFISCQPALRGRERVGETRRTVVKPKCQ